MRNIFALSLLLISGCAAQPIAVGASDSYWTLVAAPLPVQYVVLVDRPDGRAELADFWNAPALTCEINRRQPSEAVRCSVTHCYKHAAGYAHPLPRGHEYAMDCGDGSMWSSF